MTKTDSTTIPDDLTALSDTELIALAREVLARVDKTHTSASMRDLADRIAPASAELESRLGR